VTDRLNLKESREFIGVGPLRFERIARERGWIAERGPYRQQFYRVEDLKTYRPDGKIETAPKPDRVRERACLRCRKPFPSEGAHNRLCGDCRDFAVTVRSNFDE
jgi:hypothetical protein